MTPMSVMAPDAAIVLGIASTALPFARTAEDQAERWLRILRLHGDAGVALQALGVGERRLGEPPEETLRRVRERISVAEAFDEREAIERVADQAFRIACWRGCSGVATTDLLLSVMCVYGRDFERVLQAHGTDRRELTERLGVELPDGA